MGLYYLGNEIIIFETFTIQGVPTSPTTVTFTIELPDQSLVNYQNGDPEVANPSTGYYELTYTPPDPGVYQYTVVGSGAVVAASPPGSFTVLADGISESQPGPCEQWISADDVAACCGVETTSTFLFDTAAYQAQTLLFELSGRQYTGICSRTVRPACDSCYCGYQILSRGYVIGPWDYGYPMFSYCDQCMISCSPSRVKLAGVPIRAIAQVKINGSVVDPAEYTIWNQRYLTRLDNQRWPVAQDLTVPDTEDSTFSINYLYGADVPELGRQAAAQLACELYRSCATDAGDCALPTGTTRVIRQGIVIEKLAFTSWAFRDGGWRTGMPLVDAFLQQSNPTGNKRRSTFWSPGRRQYAQEFG